MRALLVLVLCAGAIVWAGRMVWESRHPIHLAVRGLRSTDPARRAQAVQELSESGVNASGDAIRSVLPVLSDPDAGVRTAGAEALGVVGAYGVKAGTEPDATRGAVTNLTGLLKDRDAAVRAAAARALGTIAGVATRPPARRGPGRGGNAAPAPPPAASFDTSMVVHALLDVLSDPDAAVRQGALGGLRDCAPRTVDQPPPPLLAAMDDESATNRAIAVGILAGYSGGLDPLLPVLLRHLEGDEPSVREACRNAFRRIAPKALRPASIPVIMAGLGNRDRDVRRHMVSLLAALRPDPSTAVPALIKVLREADDSDQGSVEGQAMAMAYEGPAQEAAAALARIAAGTPAAGEAMTALAGVVQSGSSKRRAAAAEALGQFGPAAAQTVPTLVAYLKADDKEGTVDGESAAEALGKIAPGTPGAAAAVSALTDALKSVSISTRGGAVEALRSFGPAAAPARTALSAIAEHDTNPHLRREAASTLAAITGQTK
jgi:HEAT repeat protein